MDALKELVPVEVHVHIDVCRARRGLLLRLGTEDGITDHLAQFVTEQIATETAKHASNDAACRRAENGHDGANGSAKPRAAPCAKPRAAPCAKPRAGRMSRNGRVPDILLTLRQPVVVRCLPKRDELAQQTLRAVIEGVETLLVETQQAITPSKKATAIAFLYRSALATGNIDGRAIRDALTLVGD
ncbi:hypothetical protein [Paraburkholderia tropica]|uniref:hypothetical protein n=1 Tax=Paraburkholderia tropica TaxID=92647 RepID=UPI003D280030